MSGDPSGLAVVAHEIRSPVAALVAIADAYPDADEARQKRLLELAEAALVEHRAAPRRGTDGLAPRRAARCRPPGA